MKKFGMALVALAFGIGSLTACGPTAADNKTGEQSAVSSKPKAKAKAPKVVLKVTREGKDVLGDYSYKVKLTNNTGEPLDVDAFAFTGKDADGNKYDAMPGGDTTSLESVKLANGKTVTGIISFSSSKIVKVTYTEMLGVDKGSATVTGSGE